MSDIALKIGPADHGRRMSLAEFGPAEAQEGRLYELSRGVVTMVDVPNPRHAAQLNAIRKQVVVYDASHDGRISAVLGGAECKILLADLESERHPDLAIYTTSAPSNDSEVWAYWIPLIVIEILSAGSRDRDYVEKREEYLRFGVSEYWIFDAERREVLVLRRRGGRWMEAVVRPPTKYATPLLPGFELDCESVFRAADAVGN